MSSIEQDLKLTTLVVGGTIIVPRVDTSDPNYTPGPPGSLVYDVSSSQLEVSDGDTSLPPGGGTGTGDITNGSNVGAGGVGVFDSKVGDTLNFKNINVGSNQVTVTDDGVNNEIDIDIVPSNINKNALGGGALSTANGGTGLTSIAAGLLTGSGGAITTTAIPTGGLVGASENQTLTNKTINTADNTITLSAVDITSGTLPVSRGGTGAITFAAGEYLVGNGTGAVTTTTLPEPTTGSFVDASTTFEDNLVDTKTFQFNAETITAGNQRIYTVPDANTQLIGTTDTATVSNKTFESPNIRDSSDQHNYTLSGGDLSTNAANYTLNIPGTTTVLDGTSDTLVLSNATQTLTNKTIDCGGNQSITNIGAPTADGHIATKSYVDSVAAGFDPKESCRLATTAPIAGAVYAPTGGTNSTGSLTVAGAAFDVDGVTIQVGDRILVKNELTSQVTTIQTVAYVGISLGSFFDYDTPESVYRFWFDLSGADNPVVGDGRDLVAVDVSSDTTATDVAATLQTVMNDLPDITAGVVGDLVTATNVTPGDVNQAVDGSTATTFTINTTVSGSTGSTRNGIYEVQSLGVESVLFRAPDHDGTATGSVSGGNFTFVEEGDVNANKGFVLAGSGSLTLNTDNLLWTQFSGSGETVAGAGLSKNGNIMYVTGSTTITVDEEGVSVNSNNTSGNVLLSSGVAGTEASWGTVNLASGGTVSGTLSVANGGTGATTLTSGNVLVGNGTTAVQTTKAAPTGDFVGTSDTQTLTNKTLTAPIISTISNTGTLTLPTDTDTLVGRDTTDTLTNKTFGDDLNMGTNSIINLGTPVNPTDAATKAYIDSIASGLDVKESVVAASTQDLNSNGSISGAITYTATAGASGRGQITATLVTTDVFTIDGINFGAAEDGSRILLKDQTSADQNGIWTTTVSGTSLTLDRATDFDQDVEVTAAAFTFVEQGTVNSDNGFVVTTNDPITIGGASGSDINWVQFSGAGQITAGDGLIKTGNTLDVDLKANGGLVIESTEIAVDLGASAITGTLSVADGGTGVGTLTSGNVLVGNGTTAVQTTKAAPTGDFVGTSDTQTLTQKTFGDDLNMDTNSIINLGNAVVGTDATNLNTSTGNYILEDVRLATVDLLDDNLTIDGTVTYNPTSGTTGRGTITGTLVTTDVFEVDGVTLSSADNGTRILVQKFSIDAVHFGVYTVNISGTDLTLDRVTDLPETIKPNRYIVVKATEGTQYAGKTFISDDDSGETIGGASGTGLFFVSTTYGNFHSDKTFADTSTFFASATNPQRRFRFDLNDNPVVEGVESVVTYSVPTTSAALVGRDTTDTLTNKTMGDDLAMDGNQIGGLGVPSDLNSAATRGYVDSFNGLDEYTEKTNVLAASTQDLNSNGSISGSITYSPGGGASGRGQITGTLNTANTLLIDGVNVLSGVGNRVLLKDQANPVQNGIWVPTFGIGTSLVMTRSTDFDSDGEVVFGVYTLVEQGTVNANRIYIMTTPDPVTIGGTIDPSDIVWERYQAINFGGDGLTKTGDTLDVDLKANGGLVIESAEIAVDLGASAITGTLSVADGGTGATTLTSGNVLVGNGTTAVQTTKAAPTGDFVGTSDTQTLTNKTLTAPIISTISNTGTLTLPTDTDTLVGRDTTDTLTNKTFGDDLNMGTNSIINLGTPVLDDSAVPRTFLDTKFGATRKADVVAASTQDLNSNGSISGAITYTATSGASGRGQITATLVTTDVFTIDGINFGAAEDGSRILLKDQTSADQNGIWTTTVSGTSLTLDRATDFDADSEVVTNCVTYVAQGTTNGGLEYIMTSADPVTIGGASGSDIIWETGYANGYVPITSTTQTIGSTGTEVTIDLLHPTYTGTFVAGGATMPSVTSGSYNIAVGDLAGNSVTSGAQNTFIGRNAGQNISTSSDNTCIGYDAGGIGAMGNGNSCIGSLAGRDLTGIYTTCIGYRAGRTATSSNNTTIIGSQCCDVGVLTGDDNVIIGYQVARNKTSGFQNVIIGSQCAQAMTGSGQSVVIGYNALNSVTIGGNNVAIGTQSLLSTTTGVRNIGIGHSALRSNILGADNVGIGFRAGYSVATSTGVGYNTCIGVRSGEFITTGQSNVTIGYQVAGNGSDIGSGSNNTVIGTQAGYITTNSLFANCTLIGYQAGYNQTVDDNSFILTCGSADYLFGNSTISPHFSPTTDNTVSLGQSGNLWTDVYATNTTIQTSDQRLKTSIVDSTLGLDFVNSLPARQFKWKNRDVPGVYENLPVGRTAAEEDLNPTMEPVYAKNDDGTDMLDESDNPIIARYRRVYKPIKAPEKSTYTRTHYGFIAQEVKSVLENDFGQDPSLSAFWCEDELINNPEDPDIYDPVTDTTTRQGIRSGELLPILWKAVQELSAQVSAQQQQIADLQALVESHHPTV